MAWTVPLIMPQPSGDVNEAATVKTAGASFESVHSWLTQECIH